MLPELFHFLRPAALLGLIPLAIIIYFWIRHVGASNTWRAAVSEDLLAVLMDPKEHGRSRGMGYLLSALACIGLIGIAGPTWERLPQNVEKNNESLVIVLDLSLSMLAEDVSPSRVERAKQKIVDILRLRQVGMTALVVFAGDAHKVVPLTEDTKTIENLLVALTPAMMPVFGSDADHGVALARELLANAGMQEGRIVLLTDGLETANIFARHRSKAFPISIIGVGKSERTQVPLSAPGPDRQFLTDDQGRIIKVDFSPNLLTQAAQQSYGNYAPLSLNDADIEVALATRLPTEDVTIEVEREFDTWMDQGFWLALVMAPLLLICFRRGALVGMLLVLSVPTGSPLAEDTTPMAANQSLPHPLGNLWQGLWQRPDQRGYQALQAGEHDKARSLFKDDAWRAAALYRGGEYEQAARLYSQSGGKEGPYNLGNALAKLGDFDAAIEAYDQALAQRPDHEDAAFNKALVEQLKQQQETEQSEADQASSAEQEPSSSQEDAQEQSAQEEEAEQPEPEASEQQAEEAETEEPGEQSDAEQRQEEKEAALEKWLRRVPDDPGGLLRRKFQHETKRRLRQGDYSRRQGDQIW